MNRKILGLLGFVVVLTTASGTAMAEDPRVCEARDEASLISRASVAPVSVISPAALEQLLAQAMPGYAPQDGTPPVCLSTGSNDPRCRAERSGDAPTRSMFDPLQRQSQLAPEPLMVAGTGATSIRFDAAHVGALAAGFARDLDRPPQS